MPVTPWNNLSVVVDNLSVVYRPTTDDFSDVPENRRFRARLGRIFGLPYRADVHALKNVTLRVYEGEHVGIVGTNGSGKSTLLRTIAGIEPPTSGSVRATAMPTLLGVNAVLIPHLTGAKNIHLGLLALGYTPAQARATAPTVAELAGIGRALHRPMNTYSSGMGARLRFAIAASVKPEILLIDEALGTGDAGFTEKAKKAIDELRAGAGTIFLVSHAAKTIEEMCSRAVWLHEGELIADGPAETVALHYRKWAWAVAKDEPEKAAELFEEAKHL